MLDHLHLHSILLAAVAASGRIAAVVYFVALVNPHAVALDMVSSDLDEGEAVAAAGREIEARRLMAASVGPGSSHWDRFGHFVSMWLIVEDILLVVLVGPVEEEAFAEVAPDSSGIVRHTVNPLSVSSQKKARCWETGIVRSWSASDLAAEQRRRFRRRRHLVGCRKTGHNHHVRLRSASLLDNLPWRDRSKQTRSKPMLENVSVGGMRAC